MTIDWSNPIIHGVVIAGLIGLVGVIAAAIAGIASARIASGIAARASTDAARLAADESRADRQDAARAREEDRNAASASWFAERRPDFAINPLTEADLHADRARVAEAARANRWATIDEYGEEVVPPKWEAPRIDTSLPVRRAFLAPEIVAPSIAEEAGELYLATLSIGRQGAAYHDPPQEDRWVRDWAEVRGGGRRAT